MEVKNDYNKWYDSGSNCLFFFFYVHFFTFNTFIIITILLKPSERKESYIHPEYVYDFNGKQYHIKSMLSMGRRPIKRENLELLINPQHSGNYFEIYRFSDEYFKNLSFFKSILVAFCLASLMAALPLYIDYEMNWR